MPLTATRYFVCNHQFPAAPYVRYKKAKEQRYSEICKLWHPFNQIELIYL